MTQAELEALLGRSLTSGEVTNLALYLEIATDTVETLLCTQLDSVTAARTYDIREGYKTVFTDIFTSVTSVEHDGLTMATSDYSVRQWDKRSGAWYNAIVLSDYHTGIVTVTAEWGFATLPSDLKQLIAKAFALVSKKNTTNSVVTSKQVEDFRIAFRTDMSLDDLFIQDNAPTLRKYGMCGIAQTRHGVVEDGNI